MKHSIEKLVLIVFFLIENIEFSMQLILQTMHVVVCNKNSFHDWLHATVHFLSLVFFLRSVLFYKGNAVTSFKNNINIYRGINFT